MRTGEICHEHNYSIFIIRSWQGERAWRERGVRRGRFMVYIEAWDFIAAISFFHDGLSGRARCNSPALPVG